MAKYRKKPVEIEARQWDGTASDATPIIDWVLTNGATARYHEEDSGRTPANTPWHDPGFIVIDTLEGRMSAREGDWIIRGVQGEFYPIKPDIFEQTYEEVSDD